MDHFVIRANIDHFRKLLVSEQDEHKRTILNGLLGAEERKLIESERRQREEILGPRRSSE